MAKWKLEEGRHYVCEHIHRDEPTFIEFKLGKETIRACIRRAGDDFSLELEADTPMTISPWSNKLLAVTLK